MGRMLDGLFAITREFEMPTQPHLLLLQKTMVMEEGVALSLDPDINMFDAAGPFVTEWVRSELGPEAAGGPPRQGFPHVRGSPRTPPPPRTSRARTRRRTAAAAAPGTQGRREGRAVPSPT
jgi:ubiquinone biosynthesis protein